MSSDDDGPGSLPPQDIPAEEEVLGALLLDGLAIEAVAGMLLASDFSIGIHRTVYAAMLTLWERQQPVDISLVRAELEQRGELDKVGGVSRLVAWVNAVPTAMHVLHYASVVADRALRRRLLRAAGQIGTLAYEAPTAEAAAVQAESALQQASYIRPGGKLVDFGDLAALVWDAAADAADRAEGGEVVTPGLLTGIADLDIISGGVRPGELVLAAARPGVGKTSLGMQIAVAVAQRDVPVLVFTLEMAGKEVVGRALWQHSRLNGQAAVEGTLGEEGLERLAGAVGELAPLPIRIDDTGGLPLTALVARCRTEHARRPLGLVIVDYLQLLKGTPRRDGNRTAEVTEISQGLKILARDLACPVLAMCQLNREVERRPNPQPFLSDLRDSGSLEQDADQVWLLWKDDPAVPVVRLHVAKNRNGPTGNLALRWNAPSTRFDALEKRYGA